MSKPEPRELNVMRTRKKAFKKGESVTMMNFQISSKALFQLSGEALKLYMMFLLNGKKSEPSKKKFSRMMKKSVRSIDTYYSELKEKGFLKIVQIGYNRYRYDFDLNGNIDHDFGKDKEEPKKKKEESTAGTWLPGGGEVGEPELISAIETPETVSDFNKEVIETSKEIMEFEDFAVLETVYWQLPDRDKKEVVNILLKRYQKEEFIKDAIEWIFEKIDKEELLNGE